MRIKSKGIKSMKWTTERPDYACVFLTKHQWAKDKNQYSLWKFDWVGGEPPENAPEDIHENTSYYYLGWFENNGDEWDAIEACNYDGYLILEKLPGLNQ